MKRIMVRYKVKADRKADNETPIRAVSEQLAHKTPVGLRYAAFNLPEGQSFAPVVSIERAGSTNPPRKLAAKRRAVCDWSIPGAGP